MVGKVSGIDTDSDSPQSDPRLHRNLPVMVVMRYAAPYLVAVPAMRHFARAFRACQLCGRCHCGKLCCYPMISVS